VVPEVLKDHSAFIFKSKQSKQNKQYRDIGNYTDVLVILLVAGDVYELIRGGSGGAPFPLHSKLLLSRLSFFLGTTHPVMQCQMAENPLIW
jgi:hypothetical protein